MEKGHIQTYIVIYACNEHHYKSPFSKAILHHKKVPGGSCYHHHTYCHDHIDELILMILMILIGNHAHDYDKYYYY